LSGLIYPWTMLHLFWLAFERRKDVELFVLGPYFGNWIPWQPDLTRNGMTVDQKYVKQPNFPLPKTMAHTQPDPFTIQKEIPFDPDIWIQVDAGWCLSRRPKANIVAHIQTDPHVLKTFYVLPKSYSDLKFCMQSNYMENGEIYLPYAFDPTIHYPMNLQKEYDACLIGLNYDHRAGLINRLRSMNVNVFQTIGLIYDEYRIKYNQSKVALSWSSLQDMPARVWEAFGMKLPLVTNRVPDLSNWFVEGEHYLGFKDVNEGVKQTLDLLANPAKANEMACNAYRKVVEAHTYDKRVEQILDTARLI
jgi:hypothetical protein